MQKTTNKADQYTDKYIPLGGFPKFDGSVRYAIENIATGAIDHVNERTFNTLKERQQITRIN